MTADTALNLQPILQPILEVIGLAIAGIITAYVPKAIAAFEARTGLQLTAQQKDTIRGAVQTAAGEVETLIDQKALAVANVKISDPAIQAKAQAAISAVPSAMSALGMTPAGVAKMIVGAVDTGSRTVAPTA